MTDIVDPITRSRMMAGIRSKGTRPETLMRSLLHKRGLRFARTPSELPGKPDVFLPRWRVAVFVNGCFWHMHECELFRMPSSNREFWKRKLSANRARDLKNTRILIGDGWKVLTIWECSVRGTDAMRQLEQNMDRVAEWIRSNTRKNHCVHSGTGLTCGKYDDEGN